MNGFRVPDEFVSEYSLKGEAGRYIPKKYGNSLRRRSSKHLAHGTDRKLVSISFLTLNVAVA